MKTIDNDVCALDEIPSGTARKFELCGVAVSVVRIDDDVYAIGDLCSHAPLAVDTTQQSLRDDAAHCVGDSNPRDLSFLETKEGNQPRDRGRGVRRMQRGNNQTSGFRCG